jgi:hypothetical protein
MFFSDVNNNLLIKFQHLTYDKNLLSYSKGSTTGSYREPYGCSPIHHTVPSWSILILSPDLNVVLHGALSSSGVNVFFVIFVYSVLDAVLHDWSISSSFILSSAHFGEKYKLRKSSSRTFLQTLLFPSGLCSYIFLSKLFSQTYDRQSSPRLTGPLLNKPNLNRCSILETESLNPTILLNSCAGVTHRCAAFQ